MVAVRMLRGGMGDPSEITRDAQAVFHERFPDIEVKIFVGD